MASEDERAEEEEQLSEKTLSLLASYSHEKYNPDVHCVIFTSRCPCNINLHKDDDWLCKRRDQELGWHESFEKAASKITAHLMGDAAHGPMSCEDAEEEIAGTEVCILARHVKRVDMDWYVKKQDKQREKARERRKRKQPFETEDEVAEIEVIESRQAKPAAKRFSKAAPPTPAPQRPVPSQRPPVAKAGGASQLLNLAGFQNIEQLAVGTAFQNIEQLNAKELLLEQLARCESSMRSSARVAAFMVQAYTEEANMVQQSPSGCILLVAMQDLQKCPWKA